MSQLNQYFKLEICFLKNTKLKYSTNSNTINDFSFAYYGAVQDAFMEGYE